METRITPTIAEDAYSFDRYGRTNWARCTRALLKAGYTLAETELILRSKWTRWAADAGGKRYGRATAKDLMMFVRAQAGYACRAIGVRPPTELSSPHA